MFIHLYKIPPHFTTFLGRRATSVIPIALLIHIAVAIWMLSNKSIFTKEITDDHTTDDYNQSATHVSQVHYHVKQRVMERATFSLFILFFVIIFLWISIYFSQILNVGLSRIYTFYFGCCRKKEDPSASDPLDHIRTPHKRGDTQRQLLKSTQAITYVRAVQRNLIKGLATYNILQNPAYKEDFGITWKFAIKHKEVRSVRRLKLRAQRSAIEDDAAEVDSLQRHALSVGITERLSASRDPNHQNNNNLYRRRPSSNTPAEGSATSETSRISVKSVTKNRSFYGSFYEQQEDDKIVLQIDTQKEFNKMVGKGAKQSGGTPSKIVKGGGHQHRTPTKSSTPTGETKKLPSQHPRKAAQHSSTVIPPPNTTTPPSGKKAGGAAGAGNKHALHYSSPPREDKPVPLRNNYHPLANRPMPPPPPVATPISDAKPFNGGPGGNSQRSVHSNSPTPRRYGNPNDVIDVEAFEIEMRPGLGGVSNGAGLGPNNNNYHRFSPYPGSPPPHQYANVLRNSFPNQQAPPPGAGDMHNSNSGRRNGPPIPPPRPGPGNNYY